jgi:acetyl-CoA acyltransferase
MATLLAGLPTSVPAETVNRLCASGMSAVAHVARQAKLGEGDLYVAGGVESMTRAPYVLSKSGKPFGRDMQMFDTSIGWRFVNPALEKQYGVDAMGETAENVAEQYGVSRQEQDVFACRTQERAAMARQGGRFAVEIAPVQVPGKKRGETATFAADEFLRPETTLETLAKLKPAFRQGGSVTAGNSSGINDGAAAFVVTSREWAEQSGHAPRAVIRGYATTGVDPRVMGIGPVEAVPKALAHAGLQLTDIDLIEVNEAFAAQSLAVMRLLHLDDQRVNVNGGAIALGHPVGASGARVLVTLLHEMERRDVRLGLAALCVGGGQGIAMVIEREAA